MVTHVTFLRYRPGPTHAIISSLVFFLFVFYTEVALYPDVTWHKKKYRNLFFFI